MKNSITVIQFLAAASTFFFFQVTATKPSSKDGEYLYDLAEQRKTHFDAAIYAFQHNLWSKAVGIFSYIAFSCSLQTQDPLYHSVTANLAILQFSRQNHEESLQWSKCCQQGHTDILCRFYTGVNLFLLKEYYSAFMVFRHISIATTDKCAKYTPTLSFNMGILLYKMGGNGNEYLAEAITQLKQTPHWHSKITKYENAKRFRGIDHTIEWGPVQQNEITLFDIDANWNCIAIKEIQPLQIERPLASPSSSDNLLDYYFMTEQEKDSFPSPHQISDKIDHHQDYFSSRNKYPKKRVVPKIVVTLPEILEEVLPHSAPPIVEKNEDDYFSYDPYSLPKSPEKALLPRQNHLSPPIHSSSLLGASQIVSDHQEQPEIHKRPNFLQRFCSY